MTSDTEKKEKQTARDQKQRLKTQHFKKQSKDRVSNVSRVVLRSFNGFGCQIPSQAASLKHNVKRIDTRLLSKSPVTMCLPDASNEF